MNFFSGFSFKISISFFNPPSPSLFIPKIYTTKLVEEVETKIKEFKPEEVVIFLEKKVTHEKYLPSDVFFLLAKAKDTAGIPAQDIIVEYKNSMSISHKRSKYLPSTLSWFFKKYP